MTTISEIRQKYPQYEDLSDEKLATALHQKHYSDIPFEEFSQKIGLTQAEQRLNAKDLAPRLLNGPVSNLAPNPDGTRGLDFDAMSEDEAQRVISGRAALQTSLQGATFGFSDEIQGGLAAILPGGRTGEEAKQLSRDLVSYNRQQNPKLAASSEIIGGFAAGGQTLAKMGMVKGGAVAGGLYGAGVSEGNIIERSDDAAKGAALGAAGGYILQKVGGGILSLMQADDFVVNGALTDKARRLIQSAGVDPDDFTPDEIQTLMTQVSKGVAPDEAARIQTAQSLPVEVPLTTGQRTQNPDNLRLEANAFDGRLGGRAFDVAEQAKNRQQQALQDNAGVIREQFTQRGAVASQDGGTLAANRIQDEAAQAKDAAVSLRERAKQGEAFAPKDIVKSLSDSIEQRLKTGVDALSDDEVTQVTGSLINPAKRILDANNDKLSVNALIGLRRTISNASSTAKGSAKNVLGDAVEQLDNALNDAAENALITGDKEAVKAWSDSTKLFADYYKKYQGKEGARKVIANIASGDTQPEDVSRILLGARGVKQSNRGLSLARELKSELGVDSAEWQAIRGEALTRLIQDTGERGNIGVKFSSELEKALTDHPAMMRELFDADEVRMLRQFGRVVRIVNSQARSTANPSRSGDLLNFMNRMGGGPLIDLVRGTPVLRDVAQAVAEGRNARQVKKLVQPK